MTPQTKRMTPQTKRWLLVMVPLIPLAVAIIGLAGCPGAGQISELLSMFQSGPNQGQIIGASDITQAGSLRGRIVLPAGQNVLDFENADFASFRSLTRQAPPGAFVPVPRSRLRFLLPNRHDAQGRPEQFEVDCDDEGNFITPPLPAEDSDGDGAVDEVEITALPPEGQQGVGQSPVFRFRPRAGRIFQALHIRNPQGPADDPDTGTADPAEPGEDLPTTAVNIADYFPTNDGDQYTYQELDANTLQPTPDNPDTLADDSIIEVTVGGVTTISPVTQIGDQFDPFPAHPFALPSQFPDSTDLIGDPPIQVNEITEEDWWVSDTAVGLSWHGAQTFFGNRADPQGFEQDDLQRVVLAPPVTIPNGLNLGDAGTSSTEVFVNLVTSLQEGGAFDIDYQLMEIGSATNPFVVPAGSFTDWIRVRFSRSVEGGSTFALDMVLARGVGLIFDRDVIVQADGTEVAGTIRQLLSRNAATGPDIEPPAQVEPTVVITSPSDGDVGDRVVHLSGTVTDDTNSVTTVEILVDYNFDTGEAASTQTAQLVDGAWEADAILTHEGETLIKVRAVNVFGQENFATVTLNYVLPTGVTAPRLQLQLTWDTSGTDLDDYVIEPNGHTIAYYSSAAQTGNPGDGLDFDNTFGYGPENITLTDVDEGDYALGCNFYYGSVPSNAVLRVFIDGVLQREDVKLLTTYAFNWTSDDSVDSYFNFDTAQVDGAGNITLVGPTDPFPVSLAGLRSVLK